MSRLSQLFVNYCCDASVGCKYHNKNIKKKPHYIWKLYLQCLFAALSNSYYVGPIKIGDLWYILYYDSSVISATLVSDTLKALNISINVLPQRCKELLYNTATLQNQLNIQSESIYLPLLQSKYTLILLKEEYEFLELKEENLKLHKEIEINKNFLESLRAELEELRRVLPSQTLNPGNIFEFLRQMEQKSTSYDKIYEEMKVTFY